MNRGRLSEASRLRLIRLLIILERMDSDWQETVMSSGELGKLISSSAENVRKDLNTLGCPASGRGYHVQNLASSLKERLSLLRRLKAGLAGLDSWGTVLLRAPESFPGLSITAAFDGSQNRIERTESILPLYPSYEIREVFEKMGITIGILASESSDPGRLLSRMIDGGALGIINLTSQPLTVPEGIFYHQADMAAGFLSVVSRINGLDIVSNRLKGTTSSQEG